jgi:hypothetical protein
LLTGITIGYCDFVNEEFDRALCGALEAEVQRDAIAGRQGGKKAANNMTPEERSARAKKASEAAAKKRTAARLERLERERTAKHKNTVPRETEPRPIPRRTWANQLQALTTTKRKAAYGFGIEFNF